MTWDPDLWQVTLGALGLIAAIVFGIAAQRGWLRKKSTLDVLEEIEAERVLADFAAEMPTKSASHKLVRRLRRKLGVRPLTGTVTFLATGIEGYVALWRQHRQAMEKSLDQYDELLARHVEEGRGYLAALAAEGGGTLVAFRSARDAITCAIQIQRSISSESWPDAATFRLKMAVHTGEGRVRDESYVGEAVDRVLAWRDVAYGGQILVSAQTKSLVPDTADDVTLKELGRYIVGESDAESLFHAYHPQLEQDFPPLDARPEGPQHNLPATLTSFVGRRDELLQVKELLRRSRLVTLTGPGGYGKTRLALEAARELVDEFKHGVRLVELAALSEPELVPQQVASVIAGFGSIHVQDLEDDQRYVVDCGYLAAADPTVGCEMFSVGGWTTKAAGGEGMLMKLTGPGRIYVQTHSAEAMLAWLV